MDVDNICITTRYHTQDECGLGAEQKALQPSSGLDSKGPGSPGLSESGRVAAAQVQAAASSASLREVPVPRAQLLCSAYLSLPALYLSFMHFPLIMLFFTTKIIL